MTVHGKSSGWRRNPPPALKLRRATPANAEDLVDTPANAEDLVDTPAYETVQHFTNTETCLRQAQAGNNFIFLIQVSCSLTKVLLR
jgi:hypothetical protein